MILSLCQWLFFRENFFFNKFEESADFLLVKSLAYVESFHLVLVATLAHLDFDSDVTGVVVGQPVDVETPGFFKRGCGEVGLVSVFNFGGHA